MLYIKLWCNIYKEEVTSLTSLVLCSDCEFSIAPHALQLHLFGCCSSSTSRAESLKVGGSARTYPCA